MIGATLVIHRRLLPGWRPFLRSPTTLSVGVQLAVWTVLAVAAGLPIDHAAHFGGLLTGAAAAWIMTRAFPRRPLAWLPFAAALGLLVAVAVWPSPGRSAWEMDQLVRSASSAAREALQREDLAGMERELKRLEEAGHHSDEMDYLRAVAAFTRDDLESAAAIGERLLQKKGSAPLQEAAASVLASVGYRYYRGEGVAADAERGYRYIRQACQAGLAEACRAEQVIRTGELPVAPGGPGQ
jgi:TPR repeat protein